MFTLPVCGTLPASKTHAARRWSFQPAADVTSPSLGVVTIVQGTRDLDSYGVAVEGSQVLFAKLDADADVYAVTLAPSARPVHCTCKGFAKARHCKHVDAARELIADGVLPVVARPDTADLQGGF